MNRLKYSLIAILHLEVSLFLDKKAQGRHNFLNLRPMFAE